MCSSVSDILTHADRPPHKGPLPKESQAEPVACMGRPRDAGPPSTTGSTSCACSITQAWCWDLAAAPFPDSAYWRWAGPGTRSTW